MKQFFTILFGGLFVVALGVVISYGGAVAWRAIRPELAELRFPTLASVAGAIMFPPADGTAVSGLRRTVQYRYTASEEEDLITAATMSLPYSGGKSVKGGSKVTALAYLVKNLTGTADIDRPVSLNPDRLMPIASLTKLVTAAVAHKLIPLNQRVTISE
ncbi:MAG: Beta-lactamase, partial [Candidatus Parcubacteria bacterium]|nr:Beta-lactamase [Candidatus Parcubacteria bacterium]